MPPTDDIRYDRVCRTPTSECYLLSLKNEPFGRIELHFASTVVYGLLILEREMPEEDLHALIEKVDEELVFSADQPRDDFLVTVYQGRELGVYSDSLDHSVSGAEEEEGNGRE